MQSFIIIIYCIILLPPEFYKLAIHFINKHKIDDVCLVIFTMVNGF